MKTSIKLLVLIWAVTTLSNAQDVTTWRGPDRDGKYTATNLLKSWPAEGPQLVWSDSTAGLGYTSPAMINGKVYTAGMIDSTGYVMCYDMTGKKLWQTAYGLEWTQGFPGARSNLAYDNGALYFLSGRGLALKFDISTGKIVWQTDLRATLNTPIPNFGYCELPLVAGNEVVFTPGGSTVMAVLDTNTGKLLRKAPGRGENSAYCSARLVEHNGRKIWLNMTKDFFYALDFEKADTLFTMASTQKWTDNCNTPWYDQASGSVFITSPYATGSKLISLDATALKPTIKWQNEAFDIQIGGYIVHNGFAYGSAIQKRNWACIDLTTGTTKYISRSFGIGSIVMADGLLYCFADNGDMALVEPSPEKFEIVSKFKAFNGSQQFSHPVIANGLLLLRNQNKIKAYKISAE